MHQNDRLEEILRILKQRGYVTVKFLTEELDYSTATINRDLNLLQSQHRVKRSYGGVELENSSWGTLEFRQHKMRSAKKQVAKCAAGFIEDGDVVFIDATTTTQCMAPHISNKDITVITNNLAVVSYLSEHGVRVVCTGGTVVETPYFLGGRDAIATIEKYRADKCFFSAGTLLEDGSIGRVNFEIVSAMSRYAKRVCFLLDHEKFGAKTTDVRMSLSDVDTVISDVEVDEELRQKFPNVQFVVAND